ncbi:MAG TPA: OmpA family protein [Acidisphaera sp.]|nr:OmpA family protein [Acidisphaera sp.]
MSWTIPPPGSRSRGVAWLLCALLASCGLPANVVVLVPDETGSTGKVIVRNTGGAVELDRSLAAVATGPGHPLGKPFIADQKDVDRAFADTVAATPRAPKIFVLYFLNDQAVLDPKSRGDEEAAIAAARATPNADISISGHADATGTAAENETLSRRRAELIRDALVTAGVSRDIMSVEYHGANNPRVKRPPGVAEPLNRRVEVTIR